MFLYTKRANQHMLKLIGLGLDIQDMSIKGLQEIMTSDELYLEEYTSHGITIEQIEDLTSKKPLPANREFIESGKILENAKEKNITLLIVGDPLIATTHTDLLLRCKKQNIKMKVIHNNSIYNAVTDTGLQLYKFGKTTTITYWEPNFEPTSFLNAIEDNQKLGLHTLCLLDIKKGQGKFMTPKEAIKTIESAQQKSNIKILEGNTKLIVCSRMGKKKKKIFYLTADEIKKIDFGEPLHC